MKRRSLELLSPAANANTAIQAILHGADAIYIGATSHGARKGATNSIEDIERVTDFAHQYRAKVYVTVNTLIYQDEITKVEALCRDLYHTGVDALIVQDMAILRMKIPPIALHASTQCDIRTPEKANFLQDVGFSQLVLARELTLDEIKAITEEVTIPVETFIHGALCVSYSGRCHASLAVCGRSANRGECAQICRLPYTLTDSNGRVIENNKYFLSLKDFNATHSLENLIEAGVSSFKIEGRLKDTAYVKNITSWYNLRLNDIISRSEGKFERSSKGDVTLNFNPKPDKSFNRGFTDYFLSQRKPLKIASLLSPKSMGERITDTSTLNNGDGISYYDKRGEFTGVNINRVKGNRIIPARKVEIPKNTPLYRTSDVKWDKMMDGETATRKIPVSIEINNNYVSVQDTRNLKVILPLRLVWQEAKKKPDYQGVFEKLGNTQYSLLSYESKLDPTRFYRNSEITELRRNLISLLDSDNKAVYPYEYRRPEDKNAKFPYPVLDFKDNVANDLAEKFYRDHGVVKIQKAAETTHELKSGDVVMTTRHCILREFGMCKKEKGKSETFRFPLFLNYDGGKFQLDFDCKNCEMKVLLP